MAAVAAGPVATATAPASAAGAPGLPTVVVRVGEDGTGFGTSDACPIAGPGGDNDAHDGVVCTNDAVQWLWGYDVPYATTPTVVTLTQTLPAGVTWDATNRAVCEGDGVQFSGTYTYDPTFRTLACQLTFPAGRSTSGVIPVVAHVDGTVPDGTQLAPVLQITGGTAPTSTPPPVTVRAHPRINLVQQLEVLGPTAQGGGGIVVAARYWGFQTDTGSGKGMAALTDPITWTEDISAMTPHTQLWFGTGKAYQSVSPTDCRTGVPDTGPYVLDGPGTLTCQQSAPGQPIRLTLTGAETATRKFGKHPAGEVTVFDGGFTLLIPYADIPPGPAGLDAIARFTGFDPDDLAGQSNYGSAVEPGGASAQPCLPLTSNDDCDLVHVVSAGGGPGNGIPAGSGTKQLYAGWRCQAGAYPTQCLLLPHDLIGAEAGYATPGDPVTAGLRLPPPGAGVRPAVVLCDTWDPAQQTIDPSQSPLLTRNAQAPAAAPPGSYTVQYTNRALADDAARRAHGCGTAGDDVTDGPWFPTVAAAGGPAAVTSVRFLAGDQTVDDDLLATVPMLVADQRLGDRVVDWYSASSGPAGTPSTFLARYSFVVTGEELGLVRDTVPPGKAGAVPDEPVTFVVTPSVRIGNPAVAVQDVLTVTETLDRCLVAPQVDAATLAAWQVTVQPADVGPDGLACTADDVAPAGLVFTSRSPVTPDQPVPPIRFTGTVSFLAADGYQLTESAVVTAPRSLMPDPSVWDGVVAQQSLVIRATRQLGVSKAVDAPLVEVHDPVGWTVAWDNASPDDAGRTQWVDVLPFTGDGRGTQAAGRLAPTAVQVLGARTADVTVEVTDRSAASVSDDPADPSNGPGGTTAWCPLAQLGTAGCPAALGDVTAVRVTVGDMASGRVGGLHVAAIPVGGLGGDRYVNQVGPGDAAALLRAVPASNPATVDVVASSVGRTVWWDADGDGTQDPGETGIPGVGLRLLDSHGAVLATTTTDAAGHYTFAVLHSGRYEVVVDPSGLPAGAVPTYDLDGGTTDPDGRSGAFDLAVATDRVDVNFGYRAGSPTPMPTPTPRPTPTPTPTPSAGPAPVDAGSVPAELAHTGADLAPLVPLGVGLGLLGGLALIAARRTRRR
jgi:hypothetical protein